MSTFSNTPPLPAPSSANPAVTSGAQSSATSLASGSTTVNAGAISTILTATSSQLTLATANGKINLPAPGLPAVLDAGKDVAINVNSDKSNPILEVAAKYSQQRLALSPQQSQQVLQTLLQNPGSLSKGLEVKGRVVSIQQNHIQVNVNGQTVNLSVRNPQQYQAGQDVKLGLSAGTLGWEATVQNSSIKESFRLPVEESRKILNSLRPGQPIELSEKGKQLVRPILRESSSSQLPTSINKVSLRATEGRLVAQLDIGNATIAKIPINNNLLQALSNVDLRGNSGNPSFKENSLQGDINKLLNNTSKPNVSLGQKAQSGLATASQLNLSQGSQNIGASSGIQSDDPQKQRVATNPDYPQKQRVATNPVYRNPVANTVNLSNIPDATTPPNRGLNNEVSPDIAKTIKVSQEQFSDIGIKTKPSAPPVVNEIRISQQKNAAQAVQLNETTKPQEKPAVPPLSHSAQHILNTLKSLNTESSGEVRQTMLHNLSKLVESLSQSGKTPGASAPVRDVLTMLRQVSEQTATTSNKQNANNQSANLLKAVNELLGSNVIDENIKGHVKQAINQVRPEQAGAQIPDMQGVKQLLQSATLPLTPVSLVTPTPSAGLVAGLVNLLQVSLAARMNRGNQQLQDKISSSLSNIIAGGVKPQSSGKSGTQNMRELSNLEQKHNMVKVLSDMVNQHSQQKIQNAERNLQGQEGMYYVLPFGNADDQRPAELLVQRDKPEQQDNSGDEAQTKAWQLTMKLPVGELGEILTKSKVTEDSITVDLYTSNEELKNLTMNYLPLLKRRFDDLGLNLEIGRCERGNIPEQLAKNPYQILETRV